MRCAWPWDLPAIAWLIAWKFVPENTPEEEPKSPDGEQRTDGPKSRNLLERPAIKKLLDKPRFRRLYAVAFLPAAVLCVFAMAPTMYRTKGKRPIACVSMYPRWPSWRMIVWGAFCFCVLFVAVLAPTAVICASLAVLFSSALLLLVSRNPKVLPKFKRPKSKRNPHDWTIGLFASEQGALGPFAVRALIRERVRIGQKVRIAAASEGLANKYEKLKFKRVELGSLAMTYEHK